MKKYIIYITTNLVNGKKYIGSHITSNINDSYLGSGVILKKAVKKYGKNNFTRNILAEVNNENEMKDLEKYYIEYYNAFLSDIFYNRTVYSAGITVFPKDKIKNIINANKGNKYNKGRTMDETTKLKISLTNKGRQYRLGKKHSEETKQKIGNLHKGLKFTDEQKNKIRQKKINHSCYLNISWKNKISEKNSKPLLQYDLEGNFIKEWKNAEEASININKKPGNIRMCALGRTKTAYKYIWKYKQN